MANAARVHAVESGKNIADNIMIAFGGAAPLHAKRLSEKLGIDTCLVPPGAGVGSAIGFLNAPFGHEAMASRIVGLSSFEPDAVNALLDGLKSTAEGFVRAGTSGAILRGVTALMRYRGQGWEIPVSLPDRVFTAADAALIRTSFVDAYARFFGRAIDGMDGMEIEIVTFSVRAQDERPLPVRRQITMACADVAASASRAVFDPAQGMTLPTAILSRESLASGDRIAGPAVVVERETSTVVTSTFDCVMQQDSSFLLLRKGLTQ